MMDQKIETAGDKQNAADMVIGLEITQKKIYAALKALSEVSPDLYADTEDDIGMAEEYLDSALARIRGSLEDALQEAGYDG